MSFDSTDTQSKSPAECAKISSSITIKGEITGSEDLLILGTVEGVVNLRKNSVTVGKYAQVNAHIYGNIIHVEGDVEGNLFGEEKITVFKSGSVQGNMSVPRLSLEDGARIKGVIDTEPTATEDAPLASKIERTVTTAPAQNAMTGVESPIIRRNGVSALTRETSL